MKKRRLKKWVDKAIVISMILLVGVILPIIAVLINSNR